MEQELVVLVQRAVVLEKVQLLALVAIEQHAFPPDEWPQAYWDFHHWRVVPQPSSRNHAELAEVQGGEEASPRCQVSPSIDHAALCKTDKPRHSAIQVAE